MPVRGIRGATIAAADTAEAIRAATRELLLALIEANGLAPDDVASIIFTLTPDLTAEAPARAARELGWHEAALMCVAEMNAAGGLDRCIRVLVHWNTEKRPDQIQHVYLHAAGQLRPDRSVRSNGHAK
jgi:chorismate mutase